MALDIFKGRRHYGRVLRILIGLVLGLALGVGFGYAHWRPKWDRYVEVRRIVLNRADDFPKGGAVLLGDSTVERLYIPTLCGMPVFNAGMSRARTDQILPVVVPLLERLKPKLIVISAGSNDIAQGKDWRPGLERLIVPDAIVVGFHGDARESGLLAKLAAEKGAVFVDPLPQELLFDGPHPTPEGRAEVKRRIQAKACPVTRRSATSPSR